MGKLSKKQQGFTTIEIVVILAIVILIAVLGYFVYHNRQSNNTTTISSSTSTYSYVGWKNFDSSLMSFKYPSKWTAGPGPQFSIAYASSPTFSSNAVTTKDNPGSPIDLFLQLSTDSSTIDCADAPCKVAAVYPLANKQLPNSVLAVVSQTSNNGTDFTQYVVADGSTKVGGTNINAVHGGNADIYIFGQPQYSTNGHGTTATEAARVNQTAAFTSDSHFKDLILLINSMKFD